MPEGHSLFDLSWVVICAALVMLMQGGFCLLESGLARAKNSINVAIKNLVDFCIASMLFWSFGFAFMFGTSVSGLVGTTEFFVGGESQPSLLTFFLFQLVFCGTATTIISGAVAERMRFVGYIVVTIIVAGLIYPVFGHWAWGGAQGGESLGWLKSRGFVDFAGSTVVHSIGGWVALAAVLVVGPRAGRFTPGAPPIRGQNLPMATMGVLVLWFGWFGFNGGSTFAFTDQVPLILVNTHLAAAFGGVAALALTWWRMGRPDVGHVMNGVIAGLVGITASCHVVAPAAASCIGIGAGIVCVGATALLEKLKIDDMIGAIPAHACAGVWGTLAVALFGSPAAWGTGLSRWEQFSVQTLGVAVCFLWAFGLGFPVIWLVNRFVRLRVSAGEESMGLNVAEHGASTEMIDLVSDMELQRRSGDFTRRVRVDPHTEIGQLASQYNRVLVRVNHETERSRLMIEQALEAKAKTEQAYANLENEIVERKHAEEALLKKEEELRQSQKLEAVGSLAGGVAHEFNNLLQAIQGFTNFAIEGLEPEDDRYKDLNQVLKAADRAAALTRQLLGFSRQEELRASNVNINEVVRELVEMLRPIIGECIDLEVSVEEHVGDVHADPGLLAQLLMNLCVNARDAMPAGGHLLITTRTVVLDDDYCELNGMENAGTYAVISVTDTGHGIPPEVQERIFDPFFTTKEVGKGTGLGLAMVYGVAEQHGGKIHVYSEPDVGTTFKIYLPLVESEAAMSAKSTPTRPVGGTETILIAEDEALVRDVAVRILERAGYSTLIAADGEQAVRRFEENGDRISLVLLDVVMPNMTGHEAYERISNLSPQTPVVFCTGYDPKSSQAEVLRAKGARVLEKPFQPSALLRTVREVLDAEVACETAV